MLWQVTFVRHLIPKGIGHVASRRVCAGRSTRRSLSGRGIRWLFKGIDWNSVKFRKECMWVPATLAAMAILFVWSGETTLGDRFCRALRIVEFLFPDGFRKRPPRKRGRARQRATTGNQQRKRTRGSSTKTQVAARHRKPKPRKKHHKRKTSVSYQALMKLLRKWTPAFVTLLLAELRRRLPLLFVESLLMSGFMVFGCDGSRVDLPRTLSNERAFALPASRPARRLGPSEGGRGARDGESGWPSERNMRGRPTFRRSG